MINFGSNSEYSKLKSVLLYKPGKEINNYSKPALIDHLRPIDHAAIGAEFDNIITTFEHFGIDAIQIDAHS